MKTRFGFLRRNFALAAVRIRERHEEEDAGSSEDVDGTRSTDFEDRFVFDAMVMRVDGIPLAVRNRGIEDVLSISKGARGSKWKKKIK